MYVSYITKPKGTQIFQFLKKLNKPANMRQVKPEVRPFPHLTSVVRPRVSPPEDGAA